MADGVKGTDGYADEAEKLLVQYEKIDFEASHAGFLPLIPKTPCTVLDIGSGTGRDAAFFAASGHDVVAVEPTDALRIPASQLHPSPSIEWVDDGLPYLRSILDRDACFDLVWLSAVWMHLDAGERETAMPVLASLMRSGGTMIMSLRHGPVPPGRRMFDVSAGETIDLAEAQQLYLLRSFCAESIQDLNKRAGVTWTRIAFEKPEQ